MLEEYIWIAIDKTGISKSPKFIIIATALSLQIIVGLGLILAKAYA